MKGKIIIAVIVTTVAVAAAVCIWWLRGEETPEAATVRGKAPTRELLSDKEFQSEALKMKEPDPDPDDFKSFGDIKFDEQGK